MPAKKEARPLEALASNPGLPVAAAILVAAYGATEAGKATLRAGYELTAEGAKRAKDRAAAAIEAAEAQAEIARQAAAERLEVERLRRAEERAEREAQEQSRRAFELELAAVSRPEPPRVFVEINPFMPSAAPPAAPPPRIYTAADVAAREGAILDHFYHTHHPGANRIWGLDPAQAARFLNGENVAGEPMSVVPVTLGRDTLRRLVDGDMTPAAAPQPALPAADGAAEALRRLGVPENSVGKLGEALKRLPCVRPHPRSFPYITFDSNKCAEDFGDAVTNAGVHVAEFVIESLDRAAREALLTPERLAHFMVGASGRLSQLIHGGSTAEARDRVRNAPGTRQIITVAESIGNLPDTLGETARETVDYVRAEVKTMWRNAKRGKFFG